MAQHRHCPCCERSWTRGNTETYDRSVEIAAGRLAREHSPEALASLTAAIRRDAQEMSDYMQVWRLGVCPGCGDHLEEEKQRKADDRRIQGRKSSRRRKPPAPPSRAVALVLMAVAIPVIATVGVTAGIVTPETLGYFAAGGVAGAMAVALVRRTFWG